MNRRESLKAIGITTLSAGVLLEACKEKESDVKPTSANPDQPGDRQPVEIEKDKKLNEEIFFTAHEMATITVLGDLIIPRDGRSGNASDAKVPEFIEFIAKDQPQHQVPLRGGLRWLDVQCLNLYKKPFKDCNENDQKTMLDQIAYANNVQPQMLQGAAFFDRIRSLVATGFFTSRIGMEDLGYVGNRPNKWDGVPIEIIKQYQLEEFDF